MALDINSIYGANGQTSTPDLGAIYAAAAQIQQQRQKQAGQNSLKALFADPSNLDPATGAPTQNAMRGLLAADPSQGLALQEEEARVAEEKARTDKIQQDAAKQRDDALQKGVREPSKAAYDKALRDGVDADAAQAIGQRVYSAGLDEMRKSGVFSNEQASQFDPKFDPDRVQQRMNINRAHQDPNLTASAWEIYADPTTGKTYRYNKVTKESTDLEGDPYKPGGAEPISQVGTGVSLDPKTLKYSAEVYRTTGQLPSMGFGAAGAKVRTQVLQEAARQAESQGGATEDLSRQASYKADRSSLQNLTKIYDASTAYESTAKKNFDLAMELAPKADIPNLGPFVNRWVEQGETMLGDKTIPPYVAALLTGANEYAKVMAGSTGAAGSTVDSRKEAREILSPYLNTGQIKPVIEVVEKDMANKTQTYSEQLGGIRDRIRGEAAKDSAPEAGRGGTGGHSAGSRLPKDLPSAVGVPEGTRAKDKAGNVVAVLHRGAWTAP